jgi:hypothetical protein
MAHVSQSIPNLTGGVSQAPPALRDPASVTELYNAMSSAARGLHSRPPTRYAATLAPLTDLLEGAFVRELEFSDTERYLVVLKDGVCRLFNADTGAESTVIVPAGSLAYLDEASPELAAFDVLPIGRDIFVLNRTKVVALDGTTAGSRPPEALVYVRAGDFSTTYSVTVNSTTVSHKTPSGDNADKREFIATDYIAQQLQSALLANLAGQFTVSREGNVLYVRRADGQNFSMKATDGLGGEAVLVIKGTVATEEDLPLALPATAEGFVVRVPGANSSGDGSYWLRLVSGRWTETTAPGVRTTLDAATMPHVLRRGGTILEAVEHSGTPEAPVITTNGATAIDLNAMVYDGIFTLAADGQSVTTVPIPQYDGTPWTTRFRYSVFAPTLPPGETGTVYWESSPDGVAWTVRATDVFTGSVSTAEKVFSLSLPANSVWRIRLALSDPLWPDFGFAVYTEWAGAPGITVSNLRVVNVTYPAAGLYPGGAGVTVTINGTPVTYTVPGGSQTGAQVATGLVAAVNAAALSGITATTGGSGILTLTGAVTAPTVSTSTNFNPVTTLFSTTTAFTEGALVGRVVEYLADGSTAVITANGTSTLSVGAWSGLTSGFLPGGTYRIRYSDAEWVLNPGQWEPRTVGDDTSAPGPSFIGRTISALFAHANRLGMTAGDGFLLSSARSFYRFFRESSRSVLDSDVIDVRSRARPGEGFRFAFSWNGEQYLSTERTQFRLEGAPALTPRNVALSVVSEFPLSRRCAPTVVGTRLYLAAERDGYTQVSELFIGNNGRLVGLPLTATIPHYLEGAPVRLVGDSGTLLLITDTPTGRKLWSASVTADANGATTAAWGRWTVPEPVAVAIVGGNALLIAKRPGGFLLEVMDLIEDTLAFLCLDAQVPVVGVFDGTNTAWSLPYANQVGTVLAIRPEDGSEILTNQNGTVATAVGDHSGIALAGYPYGMLAKLSPFRLRSGRTGIDRRGRLVLSRVRFAVENTPSCSVTVERPGRPEFVRVYNGPVTGEFTVPVLANADGTTLTFHSLEPATLVGLDWDGEFTPRINRV